jgi:hypothetical protein
MNGCYYATQTLHTTLSDFLEAHGRNPCPISTRRPPPAPTFLKQLERVALSGRAVEAIQRCIPVGDDDRRMIARLVDVACAERDATPAAPPVRPDAPRNSPAPPRIRSRRWNRKDDSK